MLRTQVEAVSTHGKPLRLQAAQVNDGDQLCEQPLYRRIGMGNLHCRGDSGCICDGAIGQRGGMIVELRSIA